MEGGDAGRNGDVELVEIDIVATPGEGLAVGGEDYAGDGVDGTGGAMVAGNPLRGGEGERTGGDGEIDFGVVEAAGASVRSARISMGGFAGVVGALSADASSSRAADVDCAKTGAKATAQKRESRASGTAGERDALSMRERNLLSIQGNAACGEERRDQVRGGRVYRLLPWAGGWAQFDLEFPEELKASRVWKAVSCRPKPLPFLPVKALPLLPSGYHGVGLDDSSCRSAITL